MSKPRRRTPLARVRPRRAQPWVAVWQGNGEAAASVIAGSLDADGIPARTQGTEAVRMYLALLPLVDTWAVTVPAARASEARDRLRDHGEDANIVENPPLDADATWRLGINLLLSFIALGGLVFVYGFLRRL